MEEPDVQQAKSDGRFGLVFGGAMAPGIIGTLRWRIPLTIAVLTHALAFGLVLASVEGTTDGALASDC